MTGNETDAIPENPPAVVVIPCYNAGARLKPVLSRLCEAGIPVVVADDGSTDGSANVEDWPGVHVTRFPVNRGKGHALLAGIGCALQAYPDLHAIVLMDADGQHDPQDLQKFIAAVLEHKGDLAIGQRSFTLRDVPLASWLGNRATSLLTALLLGKWIADTQCGYRGLSPRFAKKVLEAVPGGRYETETAMLVYAVKAGFRLIMVPIRTSYEPGNRSSHFRKGADSLRVLAELVRSVLRYRRVYRNG